MTFNFELCQSEFSVLSSRIIMGLSKICFLCTYVDNVIIQQRLMFCSKFNFTIFLLMFFPLCSKVFTNILKIYELPKTNNTLPKYCLNIPTCLNKNQLPGQFYFTTSSGFWIIPLLTLLKMCPWGQRNFLALN